MWSLEPLLTDELRQFPELREWMTSDEPPNGPRAMSSRNSQYRWRIVEVPHLDFSILAGRTSADVTVASFSRPADVSQTRLRLQPLASSMGEAEREALAIALACLHYTLKARRLALSEQALVNVALEFAAAAHLSDVGEGRLRALLGRFDDAMRPTGRTHRPVHGGAPGLGKRA